MRWPVVNSEGGENMAKYRKKPVVIEAIQWTGYFEEKNAPKWFIEALEKEEIELWSKVDGTCDLVIKTLEGTMRADKGDYIIKGVQGEFYPCKPDIFEATYEKVD